MAPLEPNLSQASSLQAAGLAEPLSEAHTSCLPEPQIALILLWGIYQRGYADMGLSQQKGLISQPAANRVFGITV